MLKKIFITAAFVGVLGSTPEVQAKFRWLNLNPIVEYGTFANLYQHCVPAIGEYYKFKSVAKEFSQAKTDSEREAQVTKLFEQMRCTRSIFFTSTAAISLVSGAMAFCTAPIPPVSLTFGAISTLFGLTGYFGKTQDCTWFFRKSVGQYDGI